jgi:heptosyltransferase-2
VLPDTVDHALGFSLENVMMLEETPFDYLFSLDKDREACSLANRIQARIKKGFYWKEGKCSPIDRDSYAKWLTGVFDDVNRSNPKSYVDEIFEICGYQFSGEPYVLEIVDRTEWKGLPSERPLIGLNTGCGFRWRSRLWPNSHWIELARCLRAQGYGVLMLGGEQEASKNRSIALESGATYLGTFTLEQFFCLVNQCDLVVTSVSMALHIALGLGKKIVLFNNVFNRNEFELYGLGEILEPEGYDCIGCLRGDCDKQCMEAINPGKVLKTVQRLCPI